MIQPVSARTALAQTVWWDYEKVALIAASLATRLGNQDRQHEVNVRRLLRCLEQLRTLERWQEGPYKAPGATGVAHG